MRIGFVVSEFNYDITSRMLERAQAHAEFLGEKAGPVVWTSGVFDTPLPVKRLLKRKDVDAVVVIGAVIQGETGHDQIVAQHASRKAADLSLEHDKPVGLAITGPGMTRLQAEARIDAGKHAVEAVVRVHRALAAL
ncbi:MAG TPA: 6,7-dimethyl-8-ribityllumazine synthase [Candidatus Thermoplasmatota archaeon]|nr:6,7-dimethyl-8-ribityllumazine synthase [Candidatus Thermoplasmatota archaeon]